MKRVNKHDGSADLRIHSNSTKRRFERTIVYEFSLKEPEIAGAITLTDEPGPSSFFSVQVPS